MKRIFQTCLFGMSLVISSQALALNLYNLPEVAFEIGSKSPVINISIQGHQQRGDTSLRTHVEYSEDPNRIQVDGPRIEYFDSNGKLRLISYVEFGTFKVKFRRFSYVLDNGEIIKSVSYGDPGNSLNLQLDKALESASPQCPINLTLDAKSFVILRVASPCDL